MEKENEVKNQIEQKVDFSHKREDVDYWGEQIAKVVKDPRNITKDEWKKLDKIYSHLLTSESSDEYWEWARDIAVRIAEEQWNGFRNKRNNNKNG